MSTSSLIPEHPLVFYASLASTLGLEEAILLQRLSELLQLRETRQASGYQWLSVGYEELAALLPFWTAIDIESIASRLADQGVILVSTGGSGQLTYAVNEKSAATQSTPLTPSPKAAAPGGARRLEAAWRPSDDMMTLLQTNHGVSTEFAEEQLEDFVLYWSERGEANHAWDNKFRQHVLSRWRHRQQELSENRIAPMDETLTPQWQPDTAAVEILTRDGVNAEFIADAIPEFVLYWSERPGKVEAPNSKFIAHIRRQWRKFVSGVEQDGDPHPIPGNWQPSAVVFDILVLANIDAEFARSLVPEFVMYWRDTGQARGSWNTKFLQHVKYHWARRDQLNQDGSSHGGQQRHRTGSTRARSIAEDLADRSWAS